MSSTHLSYRDIGDAEFRLQVDDLGPYEVVQLFARKTVRQHSLLQSVDRCRRTYQSVKRQLAKSSDIEARVCRPGGPESRYPDIRDTRN